MKIIDSIKEETLRELGNSLRLSTQQIENLMTLKNKRHSKVRLTDYLSFNKRHIEMNPFREGSSRYECFEAIASGIPLKQFIALEKNDHRRKILAERYKQVLRSYFSKSTITKKIKEGYLDLLK